MNALNVTAFLADARTRLQAVYGDRLSTVLLYGSMARGQGQSDSDVDLLIVLHSEVRPVHDLRAAIHALYPLTLQYGHPVSPVLVDEHTYQTSDAPLYRTVQREGVAA